MFTAIFLLTWALFSSLMSVYVLGSYWIALWVILGFIIGFLMIILVMILHLAIMPFMSVTNRYKGYLSRSVATFLNHFILRVSVKVTNKHYIPKKGPLVIYANHKSKVDPFLILEIMNRPSAFTPKSDLYKIPLLGKWFDSIGCMKVTRNNDRETAKAMVKAIKDIKTGFALTVFPEGGIKDRVDESVKQMRAGAFKIALKSGADILPISLNGTPQVKKNAPFRRSKVKINIHPVIPYEEIKDLSTAEIAEMVMDIINTGIENGN